MDQSILIWSFILIFAVPLLSLILGECITLFERQGSTLTPVVRYLRYYILPLVAILVVMQQLLKLSNTELAVQLVQTGFWLAAIVTLLSFINAVLTPNKPKPGVFQVQIPNLFFQAARGAVILLLLGQLFSNTWQINLGGIMQALGVGSLVIALALQDTLSNLVSGFLLLFSSPFKVGDWIEVEHVDIEDIKGRVIDLNWRAVTLSQKGFGCDIIIPNGMLAEATIKSHARSGNKPWTPVIVSFSFDHPPNQILAMLKEVAEGTPYVEETFPIVESFDDFSITYGLWIKIVPEKAWGTKATLRARIFYAAKRYGFTIPYPSDDNTLVPNPQESVLEFLRSLPYLNTLSSEVIQNLSEEVSLKYYGMGEQIIRAGEPDEGLYILQEGGVVLTVKDQQSQEQEVDVISTGEFFGEMALVRGELSPVSANALQDVTVIVINHLTAKTLIDTNTQFALEMNRFIEERKRLIRLVQGSSEQDQMKNKSNHGDVNTILADLMNNRSIKSD